MLPQGHELNYDNFSQVLIEATKGQKYPLMAWRPVRSQGKFIVQNDEWESYQFEMFFLNTTYYTGANQTSQKNTGTGTSSKPIIQEWEEMKVAALDFIRVLQLVQKGNNGDSVIMLNNMFRLHTDRKKYIELVSIVGTNRLSGVRLLFEADVFTTCAIQDYVDGGLIVLPPVDESTFEPDLIVVRNEILNIVQELGWGSYVHIQSVPSATWNVAHNLGYYPNVSIVDSANTQVIGDVDYVNENSLVLTFAGGFSGKAYLS